MPSEKKAYAKSNEIESWEINHGGYKEVSDQQQPFEENDPCQGEHKGSSQHHQRSETGNRIQDHPEGRSREFLG
jgi:hypothetical protein